MLLGLRTLILKGTHTSNTSLGWKTPVMVLGFEVEIMAHRILYIPWSFTSCNEITKVRNSDYIVSVHEKRHL